MNYSIAPFNPIVCAGFVCVGTSCVSDSIRKVHEIARRSGDEVRVCGVVRVELLIGILIVCKAAQYNDARLGE